MLFSHDRARILQASSFLHFSFSSAQRRIRKHRRESNFLSWLPFFLPCRCCYFFLPANWILFHWCQLLPTNLDTVFPSLPPIHRRKGLSLSSSFSFLLTPHWKGCGSISHREHPSSNTGYTRDPRFSSDGKTFLCVFGWCCTHFLLFCVCVAPFSSSLFLSLFHQWFWDNGYKQWSRREGSSCSNNNGNSSSRRKERKASPYFIDWVNVDCWSC